MLTMVGDRLRILDIGGERGVGEGGDGEGAPVEAAAADLAPDRLNGWAISSEPIRPWSARSKFSR